ncbi:PucR protein [Mycolicibacterium litorale]|nr:PucR protein [Mycolicibacterium litorale]
MSTNPLRIADLGSDIGSVQRLLAYFDQLAESAASIDAVLQAAAVTAGCAVGVRWASGTAISYDETGEMPAQRRPTSADGVDDMDVWLDRRHSAHPLDSVFLGRLTFVIRLISERTLRAELLHITDPALLEIVLSAREHPEDRARAVQLLGLSPDLDACVLAVAGLPESDALKAVSNQLDGLHTRSTTIGSITAVLCQGAIDTRVLSEALETAISQRFPPAVRSGNSGPWVGVGAAGNLFAASASWHQALRALRFASSTGFGRRVVAFERLSSLELLADLPLERIYRNRDIARIAEIAATPAGAVEVDTLEAFLILGSLRRTATELHVHHSTVAARIAHIESLMGWDLSDPVERFLATLAVVIRRIAHSRTELGQPPF